MNLATGTLIVLASKTPAGTDRRIDLPAGLNEELIGWKQRTRTSIGPHDPAAGEDPVYIAEQAGHADMRLTFSIYQRAVKRRDRLSPNYLREFDRAIAWAKIGRIGTAEESPLEAPPMPDSRYPAHT